MIPTATTTESLWFLNTLVQIRTRVGDGPDGLSLIEHRVAAGDSPPLHVHRTEDELFYLLEGELAFQVGSEQRRLQAGEALLAPQGVPHTYRVESAGGARWLTITRAGDFERFVRALSRPALRLELPPPAPPPSAEAMAEFAKVAAAHQIELCGPPLT